MSNNPYQLNHITKHSLGFLHLLLPLFLKLGPNILSTILRVHVPQVTVLNGSFVSSPNDTAAANTTG